MSIYNLLRIIFTTALSVAVLLFVLAYTAMRISLPALSEAQKEAELIASTALSVPIEMQALDGGWSGLGPRLGFHSVTLYSPTTGIPMVSLGSIDIEFSILDLLLERRFTVKKLQLDGIHLVVQQNQKGQFSLKGFTSNPSGGTTSDDGIAALLRLLPKNAQIRFTNTRLIWQRVLADGSIDEAASNINLGVLVKPGHYHIESEGALPAVLGSSMQAIIDLYGNPAEPDSFVADGYLKVLGLDVSSDWVEQLLRDQLAMVSGTAGIEAKIAWADSQIQDMRGRVHFNNVELQIDHSNSPQWRQDLGDQYFTFERIAAQFDWQPKNTTSQQPVTVISNAWDFQLSQFEVTRNGKTRYHGNFTSQFRRDNDQIKVSGKLGELRIEDIVPLLRASKIVPSSADPWLLTKPKGAILDTQYQLNFDTGKLASFTATGRLDNLQSNNAIGEGLPETGVLGISGINGDFSVNSTGGKLQLESYYPVIEWKQLYSENLQPQRISANLNWLHGAGVEHSDLIAITAEDIQLVDDGMQIDGQLELRVPQSGYSPHMSTQFQLADITVAKLDKYFPQTLPPEASSWLKTAMPEGYLNAEMVINGDVDKIPFENGGGELKLQAKISDAVFQYLPDWPSIDNFNAALSFDGKKLVVQGLSGVSLGNQITKLDVALDLSATPLMKLATNIDGTGESLLRFARSSPLAENVGPALKGLKGAGRNDLAVNVKIPLDDFDQMQINGELTFNNGQFGRSDLETIDNLNGSVLFSLQNLQAKNLNGQVHGLPVSFNINMPLQDNQPGTVEVETEIDFSNNQAPYRTLLSEYLPAQLLNDLSGKLPVTLNMGPTKTRKVGELIRIESNLEPLAISMPKPFGKELGKSLLTNIEIDMSETNTLGFSTRQDGRLAAQIKLDKHEDSYQIRGGKILIGSDSLGNVEFDGLTVLAKATHLSLDALLDYVTQYEPEPVYGDQAFVASEEANNQPLLPSYIQSVDIKVAELELLERSWNALNLSLRRNKDTTLINVNSVEMSGSMSIPNGFLEQTGDSLLSYFTDDGKADKFGEKFNWLAKETIDIDFDYLRLAKVFTDAETIDEVKAEKEVTILQAKDDALQKFYPARLPTIALNIADMRLDELNLGAIDLQLRPTMTGIEISNFSNLGGDMELQLTGVWERYLSQHYSDVSLTANSKSTGKILRDIKVGNLLDTDLLESKVSLNWEGSPAAFDVNTVTGRVWFDAEQGRVNEVNGAATKILGLLSVYKLPKRLMLDFSDVFTPGLVFDGISGHFTLANGQAYTTDLKLDIPGVEVDVLGRIGITDQDYQQHLTVTPELSSGVAVAGSVITSVGIGAALFLGQELMGRPLDNLGRMRFEVKGEFGGDEQTSTELPSEVLPRRVGPRRTSVIH